MSDIHDVPSFQMKMSYFFLAFLDVLSSKYQKNTKDLGLSEPSPREYQFFFLPPSLLPGVSQKNTLIKQAKNGQTWQACQHCKVVGRHCASSCEFGESGGTVIVMFAAVWLFSDMPPNHVPS